jgi:hypothetical protein
MSLNRTFFSANGRKENWRKIAETRREKNKCEVLMFAGRFDVVISGIGSDMMEGLAA